MTSGRLYRSRDHRMLAGVASGTAEYFGVDVSLARVLWVVVGLATGVGILAYIAAAVLIPEEPTGGFVRPATVSDRGDGRRTLLGLILAGVGVALLFENAFHWLHLGRLVWPALLILAGTAIIGRGHGGDR